MKVTERQEMYRKYLLEHRELKNAKEAYRAMQRDGVIAKTTYFLDCGFLLRWFKEGRWA
jgi:hypothetical protein